MDNGEVETDDEKEFEDMSPLIEEEDEIGSSIGACPLGHFHNEVTLGSSSFNLNAVISLRVESSWLSYSLIKDRG